MTPTQKKAMWAAIGVGTVGMLGVAWYNVRIYMRTETAKAFREDYNYDKVVEYARLAKALTGKDIKLPTAKEFATAMVPMFDYNTPYDAIERILEHGRKSKYWPAKYKKGAASAAFEPYILAAMRGAYYTPEDATDAQMLMAAAGGLVTAVAQGTKK